MKFETIIVEQKNGIAKVTMNRPEVLNAINATMRNELRTTFGQLSKDDGVSVIILDGAGRAFSGGKDIKDRVADEPLTAPSQWPSWSTMIEDVEKPVIAIVRGFCYGSAFQLALFSDLIIASESATFADPRLRYDVIPCGAPTRFIQMVGVHVAKEFYFTGEPISAYEAERMGLVNKVVPMEKLEETANDLAQKIMRNSQASLRVMKHILNQGMKLILANALEMGYAEAEAFVTKKST